MTSNDLMALAAYVGLLLLLAVPLGRVIAWIYARPADPVERWLLRLSGSAADESMDWRRYCGAFLAFSVVSFIAVYLLQIMQASLPLNPQALPNTSHHLAFNTAVSFVTNTNWQSYGGETTLSYLTQMLGLAVQNFVSAAAGIAVLIALIRGIRGASSRDLGNFWSDLYRATVYLLLPLSVVLALVLVSQGTVQSFAPYVDATTLEGGKQTIALGPAASQVAIKQLGTNGGGFFNVNSAHPLENPTPFSNLLEVLAILLIPAALCLTFGRMIGDRRQGWALLAAMVVIFLPLGMLAIHSERADVAALGAASLEGKEVRFGIADSAIWATATTAASNGSVNAMHDSFTPLGGLVPMLLMQLGEVVFGGVGSGLYGMLLFVVVAVFIAGLMVGRTPEYLGKKIEAREIKLAGLAILAPCAMVLIGTALAISTEVGRATLANPGPHGFSEVLYALSSAGNNNGSAFAGLGANNPFYNFVLGVAMLVARFGVAVPVLALAGSLAGKRITPQSAGTMPTHGPLFVVLLVSIVMLVGALTFIPALALGPIAEQLQAVVR